MLYKSMTHFEYGALDKDTKKFVEPNYAKRRTKYSCPDCERDVHVCKGEIRIPYFAHDPDPENRCTYFNPNPSSSQQHKNAQLKLKEFLNNGTEIDIRRPCLCGRCKTINGTKVNPYFGEGKIEYKFIHNNSKRFADVALVDGDKIIAIFEIVHTHYTLEKDRPDPWFEIAANEINTIPIDSKEIVLTCLRQLRSPECIKEEEELKRKKQEEIERQNREWRERMELQNREYQERYEKSLKEYEEKRKQAIKREIQIENELKENREARIRFEEEKRKTEELNKKRDFELLQLSRQVPKCKQCCPFITLERKDWNWRCNTCKDLIKALHLKHDRE
jgi:hypothetical protein